MSRIEHFQKVISGGKSRSPYRLAPCKNETEQAFWPPESFAFWEEAGLHSIVAMTNFYSHAAAIERACTTGKSANAVTNTGITMLSSRHVKPRLATGQRCPPSTPAPAPG
jgi:uncharacterized protein (DUF1800 family)